MERFQKHISLFEKVTAVVLYLLLLLTIVTQLFFDGDVLLLMLILVFCAAVFSWLVFFPESYELQGDCLAVYRGERCLRIAYRDVLEIDTVGSFRGLKRDFDSVEVVLKYKSNRNGRRRSISCHPKNVLGFMKRLQERCPNLEKGADER